MRLRLLLLWAYEKNSKDVFGNANSKVLKLDINILNIQLVLLPFLSRSVFILCQYIFSYLLLFFSEKQKLHKFVLFIFFGGKKQAQINKKIEIGLRIRVRHKLRQAMFELHCSYDEQKLLKKSTNGEYLATSIRLGSVFL